MAEAGGGQGAVPAGGDCEFPRRRSGRL